jgi:O-acetyl-ADP-ribose deacetylase (regulator of RNase III)
MKPTVIEADLLDQDVDVIVNVWNRNVIPWWLLLPQGVSGAIKRRGGTGPFKELAQHGAIPLGGAVVTSAGRLPFKAIIHVAANRIYWGASEWSIRQSVKNAMILAHEKGFKSIGFPLIGVGETGFRLEHAKAIMEDELGKIDSPIEVRVVFKKAKKQMPWWYYGVQLIFICLLLAEGGWRGNDYFHYVFMGAILLLVLIMLIHQFIKQQAQYTIKTMMIATVVVAVFCSIYRCFGFRTVVWLLMIGYLIASLCASHWAREGEGKE